MRKKCLWLVCVCTVLLNVSCGNKAEGDIEAETASGVVLVQNQSFYEVELSNGESLYFSGFDDSGNLQGLATDKDSVAVATSYGTGFIVSADGEMVTNAHVVSNLVADKDVNKSVDKVLKALKTLLSAKYYELEEKYRQANQYYQYARYSDDVSYEDFYRVKAICEAIESERDECLEYYNAIDNIRATDSEIKYHNTVSIAYNNTHVTNAGDFVPCVVTKTDNEHDLALIQLKSKATPEGKYIFAVPEEDPLKEYSLMDKVTKEVREDKNSRLFMTGFNLGPALAITKEGVKSQFNTGTISQRTDDRLMYSIPALPGSSGSPVVNHAGELVAVNYAGLNGTQSFNYGVRVKHLRNLLKR
ncbi:MAG: serine protease [Bacteroidales bacterium]|nr:serine protease [Bacteroidales bacterium]MCM1147137.1 serine protease [Bacteroidales bacterium]MCM1205363.1 serine protease [Bacillota bacterium]MCM1509832.1 serine protease [Clostridium sp.]